MIVWGLYVASLDPGGRTDRVFSTREKAMASLPGKAWKSDGDDGTLVEELARPDPYHVADLWVIYPMTVDE